MVFYLMWFLYLTFMDVERWVQFFFQCAIFFNFLQILSNRNFYTMLLYFVGFIIYFGVFCIMNNNDIASFIIWVIYGGVIIIFFLYSLSWFEVNRYSWLAVSSKNRGLLFLFFIFFIFFIFFNVEVGSLNYTLFSNINVEEIFIFSASNNFNQELQILGDALVYNTSFLFLISSYFLFFGCILVVIFSSISKAFRNFYINKFHINKRNLIFFRALLVQKQQIFYIQNKEETFLQRSFAVRNRVSSNFYKLDRKKEN